MGLVGNKQVSNYERRETERKEGWGSDRTDSRFKRQETMMAETWMAMLAFIEFLKALPSKCEKRNERARPKEEQGSFLSRCAKLKFESSIVNIVGLAKCKNLTVEEDVEQLYIHQAVRTTIGIGPSVWKNVEEGRTIRTNALQLKIRDWLSRIKKNHKITVTIPLKRTERN